MVKTQKKPVSARALLARINRKLVDDDEKVLKTHPQAQSGNGVALTHDLGDYYSVNLRANCIVHKHIDLEAYGRELDVLADYEELRS